MMECVPYDPNDPSPCENCIALRDWSEIQRKKYSQPSSSSKIKGVKYYRCKNCGGRIYYSFADTVYIHDPITWGSDNIFDWLSKSKRRNLEWNNGYWCDKERTKSGDPGEEIE